MWSLSNGIKVILKKTDFKDDQILMIGSSFGGTSKYASSAPINSNMVNQVINLGGVGNFSATDLTKEFCGNITDNQVTAYFNIMEH